MNDIIFAAINLGIAVAFFVLGKYVFPKIPKTITDKLFELGQMAEKFVVWAREFMKSSTGAEKMEKGCGNAERGCRGSRLESYG